MHRIRLKVNWSGNVDGKAVAVKEGETADVSLEVARALVFQRQIADLVPLEELQEKVKAEKGNRSKSKAKAISSPPKDKMVATAQSK